MFISYVFIILIFANLQTQVTAKEIFVCLTLENGTYTLHSFNTNSSSWNSIAVPNQLKFIEDVDYNYLTKKVYFSVSQPQEDKGIWAATATSLNDLAPYVKVLRIMSKPQRILTYPEYDIVLFYDAGYESVLAIRNSSEKVPPTKAYFQEVESVNGNFFLDTATNKLIAQRKTMTTIYQTVLQESLPRSVSNMPNSSSLLAYDQRTSILFYCKNGTIAAKFLNDTGVLTVSDHIPCQPNQLTLLVEDGALFYLNNTGRVVSKSSYNVTNNVVTFSGPSNASSQLPFSAVAKVVSFKRHVFDENITISKCSGLSCKHFCVPDSNTSEATCTCSDFSSSGSSATTKGNCVPDVVAEPGITLLESGTNINDTSVLFFWGDPVRWTKRPLRERAIKVNSRILAMSSDFTERRTYAVENRLRQIFEFLTNGDKVRLSFFNQISPAIKSIAYDWVGHNIIWYDPAFQWLRIISLKSPQDSEILDYTTANVMPNLEGYSLALDASAGFLFFLDLEDAESKVYVVRSFMDGSNGTRIASFNASYYDENIDDNNPNHPLPGSLTVDFYKKKIWVAFIGHVFVLNYTGFIEFSTDVKFDGFEQNNSRVAAIGILNSTSAAVVASNFNGTSALFVYSILTLSEGGCCQSLKLLQARNVNGEFRGLNIYQPFPPSSVNCSALNCPHTCLNVNGAASCICSDGFRWNQTANRCIEDFSKPALPVMVYAKENKLCYRPIDVVINTPLRSDNENELCSPTRDGQYKLIVPEHFSSAIFAQNAPATKNASTFSTIIHQQLESYLGNAKDELDEFVQIGPKMHNNASIRAMAFDDLARNIYIADQDTLLVMGNSDSAYPNVLLENTTISALVVDMQRRSLYWAQLSSANGETQIIQGDLKGRNQCKLATLKASVLQMHISYANSTVIFLQRPSGTNTTSIGVIPIDVSKIPHFTNTFCQPPNVTTYNIDPSMENIARFAVHKQQLFLVSETGKIFLSHNLAQSPSNSLPLSLSSSVILDTVKSFTVLNPFLPHSINKDHEVVGDYDKCGMQGGNGCEYLCLANECVCNPGMYLLPGGQYCRPRYFNFTTGAIFVADEYHHKIFALPLLNDSMLTGNGYLSEANLLSFRIHSKAKPRAIAYYSTEGALYYSDGERRSIEKILINNDETVLHETEIKILPGVDVPGLVVDDKSGLLIATVQNQHSIVSINLHTNHQLNNLIRNDSFVFHGIAKDTNWIYAAATSNTSLSIFRFKPNGSDMTVFEAIPGLKMPVSFVELAIDDDTNLLYISYDGVIATKNLANTSEGARTVFSVGTNNVDTIYRGIFVSDGLLLANDFTSGGINVFRPNNKQKINTIGKNLFYGLGSLSVFDPGANLAPSVVPKSQSVTSSALESSVPTSSPKSTTASTINSTTFVNQTTTVQLPSQSTEHQVNVSTSDAANKVAEDGFDKFSVVLGTILGSVALFAIVVGVIVYIKKKPRILGFQRLDGAPGYFHLDEEEMDSNEPSSGSVSFRNPVYGLDEIEGDQQSRTTTIRSNNTHGIDIFAEADGGL